MTEAGPLATAAMPTGGLTADTLSGLLQQFGAMQQHLFEQSLTMMFQMFRTMHTEQVGILREEMARLEELNREMYTLLAERAKLAPASVPAAPLQAAPPPAALPSPTAAPQAADKPVAPPRPPADADPDLHIWLCQRMEAIQHERQGLWNRIASVLGKNG